MEKARVYTLESHLGEGTERTRETVITDEENKLLVGDHYWGLDFPSYAQYATKEEGRGRIELLRVTPESPMGWIPSHEFYAPGCSVVVYQPIFGSMREEFARSLKPKPASRVVSTSLLNSAEFAVVLNRYRTAVSQVVRAKEELAEKYGLRVRALNEQMEREIAAIREKYGPQIDAIQLESARELEKTPRLPSLAEIVAGAESERVP